MSDGDRSNSQCCSFIFFSRILSFLHTVSLLSVTLMHNWELQESCEFSSISACLILQSLLYSAAAAYSAQPSHSSVFFGCHSFFSARLLSHLYFVSFISPALHFCCLILLLSKLRLFIASACQLFFVRNLRFGKTANRLQRLPFLPLLLPLFFPSHLLQSEEVLIALPLLLILFHT